MPTMVLSSDIELCGGYLGLLMFLPAKKFGDIRFLQFAVVTRPIREVVERDNEKPQ